MKNTLSLLAVAIGLSLVSAAQAVHVDRGGRGQALIYPYYSVQNGQQTLLSVTNTSSAAQVMKVRIKEGYNNRDALEFNIWLPAYDVWTATIFALEDAALPGEGAAIMTSDRSCTSPLFSSTGLTLNGNPYVPFQNLTFSSTASDGGPSLLSRTREGFIEIIATSDVGAPLLAAITHNATTAIPADCMAVQHDSIVGSPAISSRPSGGLMGTASIINVAQGTMLATRAEALDGFTNVSLFTETLSDLPNLGSVNDTAVGGTATAHLFDAQGHALHLAYGGDESGSRPIDAVSAVLMADQVYNEYLISPGVNASSDWLLTFPTKQFYVDPPFSGLNTSARQPFLDLFGAPGVARIQLTATTYNREAYDPAIEIGCFGGTVCEPFGKAGYGVNVLPIREYSSADSAVLHSKLLAPFEPNAFPYVTDLIQLPGTSGWLKLFLFGSQSAHAMTPSLQGQVLRGLPVIGFWATNLVNNNVSHGVLSNYAAAVPHATSVTCVKASDGSPCD